MARPLRIEFPGALYHLTGRGNAGGRIFRSDGDRKYFLELFASVLQRFRWLCHGYCLMDTHYHLLVETLEANLSRGMRQLNGVYTQRWNWKYRKTGHIFQGRYKAVIVDKDAYLLELSRYVVLNPLRAHRVSSLDEWKWSSYRAFAGLGEVPVWLTTDWVLRQFSDEREWAQVLYRNFVEKGMAVESIWKELKGQVFPGEKVFIERTKSVHAGKILDEVPRPQRYASRPDLGMLFADTVKEQRNELIRAAHFDYGYSLKEISDVLKLHYTTISKIVNRK